MFNLMLNFHKQPIVDCTKALQKRCVLSFYNERILCGFIGVRESEL